jgi:CRP/FNR family cyclic AMP-dependent transcriptional regulator
MQVASSMRTLEWSEVCEVLTISQEESRRVYFQNPEFGFSFLQRTSERLFQDMAAMEAELARSRAVSSPPGGSAGRAA